MFSFFIFFLGQPFDVWTLNSAQDAGATRPARLDGPPWRQSPPSRPSRSHWAFGLWAGPPRLPQLSHWLRAGRKEAFPRRRPGRRGREACDGVAVLAAVTSGRCGTGPGPRAPLRGGGS